MKKETVLDLARRGRDPFSKNQSQADSVSLAAVLDTLNGLPIPLKPSRKRFCPDTLGVTSVGAGQGMDVM